MNASRRGCWLVFGFLMASFAAEGDVRANGWFQRDVYVAPTSYVVAAPTSYVVPTAYVLETPAYVATSYVLSPSYSYVSPRVARGRYVATAYVATGYDLTTSLLPTSLVYPTVYAETPVGGSCDPCVVRPPCCATSSLAAAPTTKTYPSNQSSPSAPRDQTATAQRTPETLESMPADAGNTATEPTTRRDTIPATGRPVGEAGDPNSPTPPEAPAPEKETPASSAVPAAPTPAVPPAAPGTPESLTPITPPAEGKEPVTPPADGKEPVKPPVAPGGEAAGAAPVELPPPGEVGAVRHNVQKPVEACRGGPLRPHGREG
jgi:hypothetical protein